MSAECGKCGSHIVYPEGTWPLGECPNCTRDQRIDALLAENERLREALAVYADPRHWGISRDDLNYRVVSWIGPGADRDGLPDALGTARDALAAVPEEDE